MQKITVRTTVEILQDNGETQTIQQEDSFSPTIDTDLATQIVGMRRSSWERMRPMVFSAVNAWRIDGLNDRHAKVQAALHDTTTKMQADETAKT